MPLTLPVIINDAIVHLYYCPVLSSNIFFLLNFSGADADWTKELRSREMLWNAEFKSFCIICPGDLRRDCDSFLQTLKKSADGMRFQIPRPDVMETRTDRIQDIVSAVENYVSSNTPSKCQI